MRSTFLIVAVVAGLLVLSPATEANYRDEVEATIFAGYGEPGDWGEPYGASRVRVKCAREVTTWIDDLGIRTRDRMRVCRARFHLRSRDADRLTCGQRWVVDYSGMLDLERQWCRSQWLPELLIGSQPPVRATRDAGRARAAR